MIVPYQNEILNTVLAPISSVLDSGRDLGYNELQGMYQALVNTETAWLHFLHDTEWSDGRAAIQAEATLAPYFQEFKTEISGLLSGKTGGIFGGPTILDWFPSYVPGGGPAYEPGLPGGTVTEAGSSWLMPVLVGGVAIMLLSKKSKRVA
jgi:hypothetical protein